MAESQKFYQSSALLSSGIFQVAFKVVLVDIAENYNMCHASS